MKLSVNILSLPLLSAICLVSFQSYAEAKPFWSEMSLFGNGIGFDLDIEKCGKPNIISGSVNADRLWSIQNIRFFNHDGFFIGQEQEGDFFYSFSKSSSWFKNGATYKTTYTVRVNPDKSSTAQIQRMKYNDLNWENIETDEYNCPSAAIVYVGPPNCHNIPS